MQTELMTVSVEPLLESLLPTLRVTADIRSDVNLSGADVVGKSRDLVDHVAAPYDEAGAPVAQAPVEVGEGLGQEARPVGSVVVRPQNRLVQDEQRDHAVSRLCGGGERRVVVHSQVPGEQRDRRRHDNGLACPALTRISGGRTVSAGHPAPGSRTRT